MFAAKQTVEIRETGMKILGMLLALSVFTAARADDALLKVFACMQANVPPSFSVQSVELDATDRGGGTRALKGRLFVMHEGASAGPVRVMLRIDAPKALEGASYLIRQTPGAAEDEMYVYLPSVRRVRRITGTLADGSLLGTNFSYADFRELQTAFAGASARLLPPQDVDDRPAYLLAIGPRPAEHSPYSAIRAWVDQKSCVVVKAEFDDGDGLRKRLSAPADALRQSGAYWYLSQFEMRDVRENTATTLRTLGVEGGAPAPRNFDPRSFYLGK